MKGEGDDDDGCGCGDYEKLKLGARLDGWMDMRRGFGNVVR